MFAKLLTGFERKAFLILVSAILSGGYSYAQDTIPKMVVDSSLVQTIQDLADTIIAKTSNISLDANVDYESKDSIHFDMQTSKVFMYGEAKIKYDKINLDAAYVQIEFNTNELIAEGVKDSAGKLIGNPEFTENEKTYKSKYMKYNYKTKKGFIKDAFTEEGEGFMHGIEVMKLPNDNINVTHGSFTTCSEEEHPHFEFRFNKGTVIPGKKTITGPAYLVIEGVPTPLAVPFSIFPNKTGQRSGILIPTYGESANRGFFLEKGGYYWAINDNLDFKLTGDIYSRGSWAINPSLNYVKRYKYRGSLDFSYAINTITGEENQDKRKDFSIRWSHSQDPKARPNGQFSANVNIQSSKANLYNPTSTNDFLSSTFQSSISYQTSIAGKYRFTANASHSQNTQTKMVTVSLPEISFSVNQFYPFRKKDKVSQFKWYDNITMSYSMNAKNTLNIADSLLFKPEALKQMQNGIKHSIPISSNIKIFKVLNLNTTAQFNDRTYFSRIEKNRVTEPLTPEQDTTYVKADTVRGFYNVFDFGISASLSTTIYGMVEFKKTSALRAIRHVITPSVSFGYAPDFSDDKWGYFGYYPNENGTDSTKYSYYDRQIYGTAPGGKQGAINFSIGNNLEIKVRSKKDTITGTRKIKLIDAFNISTSYNMIADSLNWSPLQMSGRTKLFGNVDLNYSSSWDFYAVDSTGNRINTSEWKVNKKLLRPINSSWSFGLRYSLKSKNKTGGTTSPPKGEGAGEGEGEAVKSSIPASDDEIQNINDHPERYTNWTIPWELNINYNFNYGNSFTYQNFEKSKDIKLVQTIGISGNVGLTPKWEIQYSINYDISNKQISHSQFSVHRDLHCWEMLFNWIPFGIQKSWNFTIRVKASVLKDLKLDKKKDYRDALY